MRNHLLEEIYNEMAATDLNESVATNRFIEELKMASRAGHITGETYQAAMLAIHIADYVTNELKHPKVIKKFGTWLTEVFPIDQPVKREESPVMPLPKSPPPETDFAPHT